LDLNQRISGHVSLLLKPILFIIINCSTQDIGDRGLDTVKQNLQLDPGFLQSLTTMYSDYWIVYLPSAEHPNFPQRFSAFLEKLSAVIDKRNQEKKISAGLWHRYLETVINLLNQGKPLILVDIMMELVSVEQQMIQIRYVANILIYNSALECSIICTISKIVIFCDILDIVESLRLQHLPEPLSKTFCPTKMKHMTLIWFVWV
jgi:hypothetical protein